MTWPNFFIVGTSRAGTTSLYNYLNEIPEVYLAPKGKIHYFFPEVFGNNKSKEEYLSLFQNIKNKKIIGEYSGYLNNTESPKLIKSTIPKVKILISLRDPIERAFSHYLVAMRSHDEIIDFDDAFDKYMKPIDKKSKFFKKYVKNGLYHDDVKKFIELFGKEKVKIIIFEEFIQNPKIKFQEILDFLELDSDVPSIVGKKFNVYGEPLGKLGERIINEKIINKIAKKILSKNMRVQLLRFLTKKNSEKPSLQQEQREILKKIYMEDSLKLEKLLNHKLPWNSLK